MNVPNPKSKFLKSFLTPVFLAVLILGLFPNYARAATYKVEEIVFNIATTEGSIFRVVYGEAITIKTKVSLTPNSVPVQIGDHVEVTGVDPYITGFYVATVGKGTQTICSGGCSFDAYSSDKETANFEADLVLDTLDPVKYPGTYDMWVFPVLDLTTTTYFASDQPYSNNPITVRLEVYSTQAELEADAAAAGDENNSNIDGPTVSSVTLGTQGGTAYGAVGNFAGGALLSIVNMILGVIVAILRWVVRLFGSYIFVPLLGTTLEIDAIGLASAPILQGWAFVRDVVNMFFILFLIAIGFGTILRIESYNYKKLLVNLIVMALLVNFSLVIGRIIIQIADAAQFTFLAEGEGKEGINYLYQTLVNEQISVMWNAIKGFTLDASSGIANTFAIIFLFVFELAATLTFGAYGLFMAIRTVALWILLITAPLAYGLMVLPATAGIGKRWWSSFIKYVLFAPIIAFFLRITMVLYQNGQIIIPSQDGATTATTAPDMFSYIQSLNANPDGVTFTQALELAMVYIMILVFMWAGLIVTRQMGIFGANAIVGLAEKGMKLPLAYGWKGAKTFGGFATRKVSRWTGVQLSPKAWVEGYKAYREKQIKKDTQQTAEKARARMAAGKMFTSFGSPEDFFHKALNPQDWKRFGKNVMARRININKHWKEESDAISAERGEANNLVSESDYNAKLSELAELNNKKPGFDEKDAKIKASLGGNLDLTDNEIKSGVQGMLNELQKKAGELGEQEAQQMRARINIIKNAIRDGRTNVVYDTNSDLGQEITEMLQGAQAQNQFARADNDEKIKGTSDFLQKAQGNIVSDAERSETFAGILAREQKLEKVRAPLSYEARLQRNELIASEKKNLVGIDSAEELQAYLNDAIHAKDRYRALAIMEKMAEDYNDNEFLNNTINPSTEKAFESNSKGMHEFREHILQKQLGMDEQSALEATSKISYINESRNHYETSRLVGVRNGRQYAYTEAQHATVALAELAKKSPRDILSRLNRLGYGGEVQHPDGSREFNPSLLGIAILKGLGKALAESKQFDHMNPNAAGKLSGPKVIKVFQQAEVDPGAIVQIQQRAQAGGGWDPGGVVAKVQKIMNKSVPRL